MITWLDARALPGHQASNVAGATHPMREMTRRAAGLSPQGWDASARAEVADLFGQLAEEWHTRTSADRTSIVQDALDRGLEPGHHQGLVIEPGSGIGTYSPLLAERWEHAVAVELTPEMQARAPADPPRVTADASMLPMRTGVAAAVVLINMFLFPAEVDRVLAPGGVVVWVNSSGEHTPIHLTPDEVAAALPGEWEGRAGRCGEGLWAVLHRA